MTSPRDIVRRAVGWVIYNGPSMIENTPIVAIVTPGSANTKTGNMAQAWILCRDVDPGAALKRAADYAICGTCVHRGPDRSCYVNVGLGSRERLGVVPSRELCLGLAAP